MNMNKMINYFFFYQNEPDNFDECYKEYFNKYFIGALNDETVIGHKINKNCRKCKLFGL